MHISRWVTTHGFALNVNTDLSYFNLIIACEGEPVTSMEELLGRETPLSVVEDRIVAHFAEVFEMQFSTMAIMLNIDTDQEARERIASRIHRTPVVTSRQFNEAAGKEVFFKCENLQRAGAFKIRGATNKIQSLTTKRNARHRGVSHPAIMRRLSLSLDVKPAFACWWRCRKMRRKRRLRHTRYGAEIVFYDRQKEDREAFALDLAERERLVMVPPYDDYFILAGQGTCGLELWKTCRISTAC